MNSLTPSLAAAAAECDDIERLPDNCATASRKGVSNDELGKIRLWPLQSQSDNLMKHTVRADTKTATLLALLGLVATKLALSFQPSGIGVAEALVMSNKAVVLCLYLLTIMPRYPGAAAWEGMKRTERYSWAALANPRLSEYEYGEFARRADASQLLMSMARANQGAARVLAVKFRRLRIAFLLAIGDVVLTIAYYLGFLLGW